MPRAVDVGINIRAVDMTRRAINSARRGFAQLRADFGGINAGRLAGGMSSSLRQIRSQVLRTSGVTRTWVATTMRGVDVMSTVTLPKMRRAVRNTGVQMKDTSDSFAKSGRVITDTLGSNLLTMGLFSVSVFNLARNMSRATIEMDSYIRGFKALDGGIKEAHNTMQEIIRVSKLPGVQVPQAAQAYMNLRSVGVSSRFATQTIEEFANAVAIAGGRARDMREAVRQMSQTLSINKIDMENWRVILERLPTMRTAIQKAFGPESIHTEELNRVLKTEGITVQDAWRRVLDEMMLQERVDPNTITNIVERIENSLWELSANMGRTYEPAMTSLLGTLNKLIEGFNSMSKPMRDFIAFMTTSVGVIAALGAATYGVSRIFTGMRNIAGRAKEGIIGRMEAPFYRPGTRGAGRAERRYGDVPDITPRQMVSEYLDDPDSVKSQMQKEVAEAEDTLRRSNAAYGKLTGDYDLIKSEINAQARHKYYNDLKENILNARVERDVLSETRRYEGELEDVMHNIHNEQRKIRAHGGRINEELLSMYKGITDAEAAYGRHFQDEFRKRTQARIQKQYEPTRLGLISSAIRKHREGLEKELEEAKKRFEGIPEGAATKAEANQAVRDLERRLESTPITKDSMPFLKQQAIMRKQMSDDLKKFFVDEEIGRAEHRFSRGDYTGFKKFVKDGEYDKEAHREHLMGLRKFEKASELTAEELARIDEQALARAIELQDDTMADYERQVNERYKDLKNVKIPQEVIKQINSDVRRELESAFADERRALQSLQDDYYNALISGEKHALARYEQQRRQLTQGYDERIRRVREQSIEAQRVIAGDEAQRAVILGPDGLPIPRDPREAEELERGIRQEQARVAQQRRGARRDVKASEGLLKRATANLKAIDHLGMITELAYEGGIVAGIAILGFAITKIAVHFQQLYQQIDILDQFMNKSAPNLTKWQKGFEGWERATASLRHGFERLTPEARAAVKSQIDFLQSQNRGLGISDSDIEQLEKLHQQFATGRRELDKYNKAYQEFRERNWRKELLGIQFGADISAEFGNITKNLDKELYKLLVDQPAYISANLLGEGSAEGRKRLIEAYEELLEMQGQTLKITGGKVDVFGEAGFTLFRDSQLRAQRALVERLFRDVTGFREPGGYAMGLGGLSEMTDVPEVQKIVELLTKRNYAAKEFNQFEKDRNQLLREQEQIVTRMPDFNFGTTERWGVAISTARVEAKRLRDTLLELNEPMQKFTESQISYNKSIVSLEDSTNKQLDSLYDRYRDAQDVYELNKYLLDNKAKFRLDTLVDKPVLDALRGVAGDDATVAELLERGRIRDVVGTQDMESYLRKITKDSVFENQQAVEKIIEQYNKALKDFTKQLGDIRLTELQRMQKDVQDTLGKDLTAGGSIAGRLEVITSYIEQLRRLRGGASDPIQRYGYDRDIREAEAQAQGLRQQVGVRTARSIAIRALLGDAAPRRVDLSGYLRGSGMGGAVGFDEMLRRVLGDEGGLDTRDTRSGGVSYAGITGTSLREWKRRTGRDDIPRSVRGLSDKPELVKQFYQDYFKRHHVDKVPAFIRYAFADYAVNAGNRALKSLQDLLGLEQTGRFDDATKQALATWEGDETQFIKDYIQKRVDFYEHLARDEPGRKISAKLLKYYQDSLKGWKNRAAAIEAQSLKDLTSSAPAFFGFGGMTFPMPSALGRRRGTTMMSLGGPTLPLPTSMLGQVDADSLGTLSGRTPEQEAAYQRQLSQASRVFARDAATDSELWEQMRQLEGLFDPSKMRPSANILEQIRDAMGYVSMEAQDWLTFTGSIENKMGMLRSELVSARKELRGVLQDEMGFWQGLKSIDRDEFIDKVEKYRSKAMELEATLGLGAQYPTVDKMRQAVADAQAQLDNSEALGLTPRRQEDIKDGIKRLQDAIKLYDNSQKGLRGLRRETEELRKAMFEGFGTENREHLIKYLTGVRLELNDIDESIPPARKIQLLQQELSLIAGDSGESVQRRQNLEAEIRSEQDRLDTYNRLTAIFRFLSPLLGEEGEHLRKNADAWKAVTEAQTIAIRNYEQLTTARRRDAAKSVLESVMRDTPGGGKMSRLIESVRGVGVVGAAGSPLLSAAERIEHGMFGLSFEEGNIPKYLSNYRKSMRELQSIVNEGHARLANTGEQAFRERLQKTATEEGVFLTDQAVDAVVASINRSADETKQILNNEAENQREFLKAKMQAEKQLESTLSLREGVRGFLGARYQDAKGALLNRFLYDPIRQRRDLEDAKVHMNRFIEDIMANEEMSRREKMERIKEYQEEVALSQKRADEDNARARQRQWEDYFVSVIADIGKIAEEQAKTRLATAGVNWLLDQIPGLKLPEQPTQPTSGGGGGRFSNIGSWLVDEGIGLAIEKGLGFLFGKFLPGSGALMDASLPDYGSVDSALGRQTRFLPTDSSGPFLPMGGGFDNPYHDMLMFQSGYNQAKVYARRMGESSAGDMVRIFESGFTHNANKILMSQSNNNGDSGLVAAIREQTAEIQLTREAIIENGGPPLIGDDEIRKMNNVRRELVRTGEISE